MHNARIKFALSIGLLLGSGLALGGCATIHDNGGKAMATVASPEINPSFQRVRLQVPDLDADNVLYLKPGGDLHIAIGKTGRGVDGRWNLQPGNLCLQIPSRKEECISYPRMLNRGEAVTVSSNQGWTGTMTMLTDATGTPLANAMPMNAVSPAN